MIADGIFLNLELYCYFSNGLGTIEQYIQD
jgi:hypothetical protein